MEIWKLKQTGTTPPPQNLDYLYGIFEEANLDSRINRESLALEILEECGGQTPRYMDTFFFAVMATNFFKIKAREYSRDLDALEQTYNPLDEFNVERYERGYDHNERTDDLTEQFDMGQQTTTHNVSADNESGFSPRNQDVTGSDTDTTTNTGTQTHHNNYEHHTTDHGRHKSAPELILSEIEANTINIYRIIARDFSDAMMSAIC